MTSTRGPSMEEWREDDEAALEHRDREAGTAGVADVAADEADVLEQAAPVDPAADEDEPEAVGDLPEADALDQARPVDAGEDDGDRR